MKLFFQYIPLLTMIILMSLSNSANSQTVVRMTLPPQSDRPLEVIVLFDEEVPENMPVVLGLMGYDIKGGIEPFSYEWMQNGKVIGTEDIVIYTPAKNDRLTLKVTDKNRCHYNVDFNTKTNFKNSNDKQNDGIKIYPTIISDGVVHISLPINDQMYKTQIRIFNLEGKILYDNFFYKSCDIPLNLQEGTYLISVKTPDNHCVEKLIIQP